MERLTEKGNYSTYIRKNHVTVNDVEQRLGEYEDLEERGLLLKLPCKIGSIIYRLYKMPTRCTTHGEYKDEYACCGCEELECDSLYKWEIFKCIANIEQVVNISDKIGETVFLTKEEAEKKLKELTK